MCSLSPEEEKLLRGLEERLRLDAPRLAQALGPPRQSVMDRWAPTMWPPRVFVAMGVVLLVAGLIFDVGSSVLGGLVTLGLAKLRSIQLRKASSPESGGQQDSPFTRR